MNEPFQDFEGGAVSLPADNINTDAIIPSAWLRSPDADLARGLFASWRYDEAGREQPDFILNQERFRNSTILFAGPNFGCGSSREAAAWALLRYGIRCVAAPSFSDIFYENAFRNGLLPALISEGDLARVVRSMEQAPLERHFRIDLSAQTMTPTNGSPIRFEIPAFRREALLRGDDEIAATLRMSDEISRYAEASLAANPWLYAPLREGYSR